MVTAEDRPDLWERSRSCFQDLWPEYNHHGNHTSSYFRVLVPRHARFQVLLYDKRSDRVFGRGRAIPFFWDGSLDDLPRGMDAVGLRALEDGRRATALSALAAEVAADRQGEGLSGLIIASMAKAAREHGLAHLVAPVRPSWKDRYPGVAIDRYATWRRCDGLPFDPWLRVHSRLGARLLRVEPRSLLIEAPLADWERWTGKRFETDGEHLFPGGLAPLQARDGVGTYFEPNVWMLHSP